MLMSLMLCQLIKKSDVGYFLEVDLEYPNKSHELHDYPLAPEKLAVSNMLLTYC